MPHREQWEARREPLEGNLHNLRSILDQPVPRVTTIPDMTRAAEALFSSFTGLDAILALVQLAIENMPDERGPVAENIYGLTEESRGKKVRQRRKLAIAAYEEISGEEVDYETFRTNAERNLIEDLTTVLIRLIEESRSELSKESSPAPLDTDDNDRPGTAPSTNAMLPRRSLPPPDDLADEIAQQTFSLVDQLVSPRMRLLSSDFDSTCDWLYDELLGHLVDVLGDLLANYLGSGTSSPRRVEPRREGAHAIRVFGDDDAYVVAAGLRLARPSEVDVHIAPSTETNLPPSTQIALGNEGRFVLASVALSPVLSGAESWAVAATQAVLDSGDRAIEAFVINQIAFDVSGAVAQLYSLVRRYFSRQIAETIRLFLLDPRAGGGMHLDQAAQQSTLTSLRPDHGVEGVSSAEKLLRLGVARFPVNDSVAAEIVPSMQTVVRSPLRIPSACKVGAIQHELFGPNLVLQPLLNGDGLWVEAGYPASLRSSIEPVLERHANVIAEHARELDLTPALQEPSGEPFDLAAARSRRREQFRKDIGHLIAGYPTKPP